MRKRAYAQQPVDDVGPDRKDAMLRHSMRHSRPAAPAADEFARWASLRTGDSRRGVRRSDRGDRSSSVDVRQHRPAAACRPLRARSLAWLLRRRQRARPAAGLRPGSMRRAPLAGDIGHALRSIHPARLEPRHAALPQFHELRPAMAGGCRLRGQPRADAVGVGGMRCERTPIRRDVSGLRTCSRRPCPPSSTSRRRAPGPSRCWGSTPIAR